MLQMSMADSRGRQNQQALNPSVTWTTSKTRFKQVHVTHCL